MIFFHIYSRFVWGYNTSEIRIKNWSLSVWIRLSKTDVTHAVEFDNTLQLKLCHPILDKNTTCGRRRDNLKIIIKVMLS